MNNRENPTNELDQALKSAENLKVAQVVKTLPQDEASMAWRSALNERLNETAGTSKRKKRMWHRIWGYSTGFGISAAAAASVLFIMMSRVPETTNIVSDHSIEAQLYAAHNETTRSTEVAGSGLASCDESDNSTATKNVKWKVEDLEAL